MGFRRHLSTPSVAHMSRAVDPRADSERVADWHDGRTISSRRARGELVHKLSVLVPLYYSW
jgi:hypothetical protein